MAKQHSLLASIKEFAIVIAIAMLVPMTIHYGATLISPYPHGTNYTNSFTTGDVTAKIAKKQYKSQKGLQELKTQLMAAKAFDRKLHEYRITLFYTCLISGIIIIISSLLSKIYLIDAGLILGASFSIIDGYTTYWGFLPSIVQFFSLIAALILVIFLAYFKVVRKRTEQSKV